MQLLVASMQRAWTNPEVSCAFATQDSPAMDRPAQVCRRTQLHVTDAISYKYCTFLGHFILRNEINESTLGGANCDHNTVC